MTGALRPSLCLAVATLLVSTGELARGQRSAATATPAGMLTGVTFTNISREAGLDFVNTNGASPDKHLVETMGSGGVLFDYNNDGWLDILLLDGGSLVDRNLTRAARHRLYRNRQDGTYEDVTAASGIQHPEYGMGACAGDYDNDGAVDLYITNFGANTLLRNRRDGSFVDTTRTAGVGATLWSTSCAFADLDRDGVELRRGPQPARELEVLLVLHADDAVRDHQAPQPPREAERIVDRDDAARGGADEVEAIEAEVLGQDLQVVDRGALGAPVVGDEAVAGAGEVRDLVLPHPARARAGVQDHVPPPDAVIEVPRGSEEQREEDERCRDELKLRRNVDAVSPPKEGRDQRERDHRRREEEVLPIPPDEEQDESDRQRRLDQERQRDIDVAGLGFLRSVIGHGREPIGMRAYPVRAASLGIVYADSSLE